MSCRSMVRTPRSQSASWSLSRTSVVLSSHQSWILFFPSSVEYYEWCEKFSILLPVQSSHPSLKVTVEIWRKSSTIVASLVRYDVFECSDEPIISDQYQERADETLTTISRRGCELDLVEKLPSSTFSITVASDYCGPWVLIDAKLT